MQEQFLKAPYYKSKGILDAKKGDGLLRISDTAKLFGVLPAIYMTGFQPKSAYAIPSRIGTECWCFDPRSGRYDNKVINGGSEIHELKSGTRKRYDLLMATIGRGVNERIVFAKDAEDCRGGYCYRFWGVYRLNPNRSTRVHGCVWERIAQTVKV